MNYKENLFFIGKCLTINHEKHNKDLIEEKLKSNTINWESIVEISTSHYVFPALYCNLKKADFLHYLPDDLVEYMEHITQLNRERNEQIIIQAKEINNLLLKNNITPVFLKGTGNLLEGLYEDIAERMVGDIDFIVSDASYLNTINVLKEDGYTEVSDKNYHFPHQRHYSRIKKGNRIAAVEIHNDIISKKYIKDLNYNVISKELIKNKLDEHFLSLEHQLSLSIIAKHINDKGYLFKNILLRNAYDVYLLSKKTNPLLALKKMPILFTHLNNFLASCYYCFGKVESLNYLKTKKTTTYLKSFNKQLINKNIKKNALLQKYLHTKLRVSLVTRFFYDKDVRKWFIGIINDKKWQQEKLIQLGLKKSKPNP